MAVIETYMRKYLRHGLLKIRPYMSQSFSKYEGKFIYSQTPVLSTV